ncbi:tRNA (cytosine(34)-C(5))-methyltransferase [Plodia interpunctella]|uniref:tRNA (cytosine(34)-C(5))-methyltransferase n=1 Tax=Plodia interpunctella TaxID=58824 RepID=UPI002367DB50|nr:tRNA (cytosine(34)-C(5))-methyltransferase [Plodia interpunctella]XP_053618623.1 tRNA (cytosine(34)-C(5))-methyltransferase [Plodia interpunctella]
MFNFSFTQKRFVTLGSYLKRMGRRNRNVNKFAQRKRDRKEQEKNPQEQPAGDNRKHYEDIVRENAAFEEYYKTQKVCPEEEWPTFMKSLKENLPTAFRITGSKCEADALLGIVKSQYFSELLNMKLKVDGTDEEEEIKPINLPWYPSGLAWQLRLSRSDIRRNEALYRLHNFLVAETAAGGVSRQETVSMIPPVVLDVQPHHKVLDMCAAPGSKTAQLIEFLHADEDKMPTGFVMANDVDNSRCYMLVHQAKRLNSPCILITNHDSAVMPSLVVTDDKDPSTSKPLKFDRILCDVPCSGDATLRKNPDIWLKWSTGNGNNLHGIQYRVLRRGCELLAIGGRLVYSTCSFNPVENEAVIHRILQESGDSLELVEVKDMLPGLKFHKGMSHWRPASKDMVFYDKYEDVPEKWQTVVRPQMFPPKPDEIDKYHLDRCVRILPHHQDTGGFFVAVFEKKSQLPWEKEIKETETPKEEKKEPPKKKRRMGGYREDPFVFFSGEKEDVFPSIKDYYDLKPEFEPTCLLTRCYVGKKKNIYLVSPIVKDVVQKNESSIKIINTGVKTFVRCDNKNMVCPFRLSQEGLQSISPLIGPKRRLQIPKEDLIRVLQNDNPSKPPDVKLFTEHTQELIKDFATGSCVLEYKDRESSLALTVVGWRGARSLRAYAAAAGAVHCLRLLRADYSKYDINKFKKASEVPQGDADTSEATETTVANDIDEPQSYSENGAKNGEKMAVDDAGSSNL